LGHLAFSFFPIRLSLSAVGEWLPDFHLSLKHLMPPAIIDDHPQKANFILPLTRGECAVIGKEWLMRTEASQGRARLRPKEKI
jgi:hypothetical protein